jgi:hypothetical protein
MGIAIARPPMRTRESPAEKSRVNSFARDESTIRYLSKGSNLMIKAVIFDVDGTLYDETVFLLLPAPEDIKDPQAFEAFDYILGGGFGEFF